MGTKVEFTAKVQDGALVWEADDKPAKHHETKVDHGAKPEEIEFRIKSHKSAKDLKLRIDCSRPFQVAVDNGHCPPAGIDTDQIEVLSCDVDSVKVRDLNTGPEQTLRYQLNVVDKDGNPQHCDPIIRNGGGGPGIRFD
jgi:hypothetical protein